MKRLFKRLFIGLVIVAGVAFTAYAVFCVSVFWSINQDYKQRKQAAKDNQEHQWRTDVEPLASRFETFSGIESAYWIYGRKGEISMFDGLGPTDYYMRGYFVLSEEEANRLHEKYTWEEVSADDLESLHAYCDAEESELADIKFSPDFDKDSRPAQSSWRGPIYFAWPQRKVFFRFYTM